MTKHFSKHTKNVLDEQYVSGSMHPLIGKDTLNLIFPRSIADCMQLERSTNLNYKIVGRELIISK
jgi:hypothetical protein